MTRLPIDERRRQIVQAALAVATRDGLENVTMRAVAAEAQVSLGVLHYCFTDKAEMMRAVAAHDHEDGLATALAVGGDREPAQLIASLVETYLAEVVADRRRQLFGYELTVASLRDPELAGIAAAQRASKLAHARAFLPVLAERAGLTWSVPVEDVARMLVREIDGAVLVWLVDGDTGALAQALHETGRRLLAAARPATEAATATPVPSSV
ncbi:TetR/AcrR family transcriptional regulator [Cellulomonas citrea]|uniref:TetR/AcrR family transcriptional regulator n=1 Tax=Cellulomonas citrea TaxID=1909423 RepID=UPI00135CCE46|nr:TetR family transcriptional regulator [Cellulomonas citrea]